LEGERKVEGGVNATAVVEAGARVARSARVGAYAVVESGAVVEEGAEVGAWGYVGEGCVVGEESRLHPRVTLYRGVKLGKRVVVHSGAVIGEDGFGYVYGEGKHWKFPQVGTVEIGDDVEIGANTTIDRGSLGVTRIANGVKIDNLVQVAHNVQVGEHSIVAAQTGISGSSVLGHHVISGGQVGIADRVHIEDGAILGAQAGIPTGKTIRAGETVWGTPARPIAKFKEQYGWLSRLPSLAKKMKEESK
jgi:UDP-3-O-[3-hydroxymyristoyl] glucosamine N-acyltransferase